MDETNPIIMTEVTDPLELAKSRAQNERADRNSAWLQAHVPEIYWLIRLMRALFHEYRGSST
jgi:hypothetical protein